MTAYRHLPASAASVLLGTALLLACAPKAQAAEDTKQDIATQAQAELVQKQGTEPEKPAVGDAAEQAQTEEKPTQTTNVSTKESAPASETSDVPAANVEASAVKDEEPAKTEKQARPADQPAEVKVPKQVTKNWSVKTTSPAPKPQERESETVDTTKIDKALNEFFDKEKLWQMEIDTARGVVPDPSLIFPNFNSAEESGLHISWQTEPDVSTLGDKPATVLVSFTPSILADGTQYSYVRQLSTTVHVYEKESDYAMVYGDPGQPGDGTCRNYFVYYDTDIQKPIAKRVFYGREGDYDESLDETHLAMNPTSGEYHVLGYETGNQGGSSSDYNSQLGEIAQKYNLNEEEIEAAKNVVELAGNGYMNGDTGSYDTTISILSFGEGQLHNRVYFVTSRSPRNVPSDLADFWGSNDYDFSDGNIPDPRYFVVNWSRLPEGSTIEWAEKPQMGPDGLENPDTASVAVTVNGVTTKIYVNGCGNFPHNPPRLDPSYKGEVTSLDDYYKHPYHAILRSDIPTVEVGTLPAARDFIKYHQQSASLDDAVWAIKPDITKAGFTHGAISFPGGDFLLVFLDVVPKKTPDPKPDSDPKPKPDPKPDPEPKPDPDPDPDPEPQPDPDPDIPDKPNEPEHDKDDDKPEDKKPEEKKQAVKKVVTKTTVVERKVSKPTVQQKRTALPQTGNKGLLVLALGAAVSIIGLGLLRKKRY
jgi:LPXTG-motif cell wall-anchored protein